MSARSDFISGLVMLAFTAIFYVAALEIEEDPFGVGMEPYVFPMAVCYVLAGLSLLLLAVTARQAFRQGIIGNYAQEIRLFFYWVLPMAAIAFAYLGLINLFQYLLPTIVILSATLAIFGNRGVKWLVVIPAISGLIYYAIFFGIFRLLEPTGILLEYDNFYIFGGMRKFIGI
jgi:hypothetical protein